MKDLGCQTKNGLSVRAPKLRNPIGAALHFDKLSANGSFRFGSKTTYILNVTLESHPSKLSRIGCFPVSSRNDVFHSQKIIAQ